MFEYYPWRIYEVMENRDAAPNCYVDNDGRNGWPTYDEAQTVADRISTNGRIFKVTLGNPHVFGSNDV